MNTREKWIVTLATGMVIYGGFELWRRGGGSALGEADVAEGSASLVAVMRGRLQEMAPTPEELESLKAAARVWPANPFHTGSDRARAVATAPAVIRYTGYLRVGAVALAILNGREYRESEVVHATDLIVETIAPDRVILTSGGGGRRVSIVLNASSQKGEGK